MNRNPVDLVIAHDYLTQRGGAERVVLSMLKAFPNAPLLTSMYEPQDTYPQFKDRAVRTMPINRIGLLRRHHRLAFPLLAPSFSSVSVDADAVCSSSGWAHAIRVTGRKVVYCHTPARWLYDSAHYASGEGRNARLAMRGFDRLLKNWDRRAAESADRYLVNSRLIQRRVWTAYRIEAEVLPPPLSFDAHGPQLPHQSLEPGFYLTVARLSGYKNVEATIQAFAGLPQRRLVVVGTGPHRQRLEEHAPSNVHFTGSVTDDELRWLYANCYALIAASYEDFGLTPLEAATFGRPTVALAWGGFLETVIEGVTGTFFPSPCSEDIRKAVDRLEHMGTDPSTLRAHAARYAEPVFIATLQNAVLRP